MIVEVFLIRSPNFKMSMSKKSPSFVIVGLRRFWIYQNYLGCHVVPLCIGLGEDSKNERRNIIIIHFQIYLRDESKEVLVEHYLKIHNISFGF